VRLQHWHRPGIVVSVDVDPKVSLLSLTVNLRGPPHMVLGSPSQARLHSLSESFVDTDERRAAHQHSLTDVVSKVSPDSSQAQGNTMFLISSSPISSKMPLAYQNGE
jgi:hypothetical protein